MAGDGRGGGATSSRDGQHDPEQADAGRLDTARHDPGQPGPGQPRPGQPGTITAAREGGGEPDPRFTLANERTFLAWNRTALALVVAGLGIVQLLPPFPGVPWGRHALGVPLIVLGAGVSVTAYLEWRRAQTAMRDGNPLPRSVLPRILAATIAGVAALSAAVLLTSAVR